MDECEACTYGWVQVTAAYVERKAPYPDLPPAELMAEPEMAERYEEAVANCRSRRAAMAWSVLPCRVCRPSMFLRWAGGHFEPGHDRTGCDECRTIEGRRTRPSARAPQPPRELRADPVPIGAGRYRPDLDETF